MKLSIWECRRYRESEGMAWKGALLIAAPDEDSAVALFVEVEDGREPIEVMRLEGVFAEGNLRVIYNDDFR